MILDHVGKKYGDRTALEDITLELRDGEITAVLGESGAGKTTLLNILAGLIPHSGTVEGRQPCSYLFQQPKLLPNLTAEGNLRFVLPKQQWDSARVMLEKVGLGGREKSYPRELSGGERQRVAIARAFLYPHDMLLMDEPFASLDLSLKKSLLELVAGLWKERRQTVVFVTHDVHEAAALAQRAIVLKDGRVVLDLHVDRDPPSRFFVRSRAEERLVRALMGE